MPEATKSRRAMPVMASAVPTLCFRFAILGLLLQVVMQAQQPALSIGNIVRLQPGWVRVYLAASNAPAGASYQLNAVCATPTNGNSIVIQQTNSSTNLAFDIKVNSNWLAANSLPVPCHITQLNAAMLLGGQTRAQARENVDAPMDLPLSLLTPQNAPAPTGTSVSLSASSVYAAYPPLIIEILSATGRIGFAEVEALPTRNSVGLRALEVFDHNNLWRELGGGGEMLKGWGLDINTLLIWRAPQLPVETSHPGHGFFPYNGTVEPPILSPNIASQKLYPDPNSADYPNYVLDNLGVARCWLKTGCMDIKYDGNSNSLQAVNGGKVMLLTPLPIKQGAQQQMSRMPRPDVRISGAFSAAHVAAGKAVLGLPTNVLNAARSLASAQAQNLRAYTGMRTYLESSRAPLAASVSPRLLEEESPQEAAISAQIRIYPGGMRIINWQGASCAVQSLAQTYGSSPVGFCPPGVKKSDCQASKSVTVPIIFSRPPSKCLGMSNQAFACPTKSDPIKVELLGPSTSPNDVAAALNGTIPPYYAGRDNRFGTCDSHAHTQYYESLLDRFSDDLAIKRVIYVNDDPVLVPEPRVAYSITAGLAQLYTWENTHAGDPVKAGTAPKCRPNTNCNPSKLPSQIQTAPWPPNGTPVMPNLVEAYWPARDDDFKAWSQQNSSNPNVQCLRDDKGQCKFWGDGFSIGQGFPAQGVYYSHAQMVASMGTNPLRDGVWSLANTYFNFLETPIPLNTPADRDAAIHTVIAQIRLGLPVHLSLLAFPKQATPDPNGGTCTANNTSGCLTFLTDMTWYLPPEMGACDVPTLDAVYGRTGGHAVIIVGYWIKGTSASPDPFSSYFIIENNWGKNSGYHSFYFMNFAAFEYLATSLSTIRLDRTCASVACAKQVPYLPIGSELINPIIFPPPPGSLAEPIYVKQIWGWAIDNLGGVAGQYTGTSNRITSP
jgi:hypothetical protein